MARLSSVSRHRKQLSWTAGKFIDPKIRPRASKTSWINFISICCHYRYRIDAPAATSKLWWRINERCGCLLGLPTGRVLACVVKDLHRKLNHFPSWKYDTNLSTVTASVAAIWSQAGWMMASRYVLPWMKGLSTATVFICCIPEWFFIFSLCG